MKFIVYTFDYNWKIGGIVVLHKLADLLAKLKYEVYYVSDFQNVNSSAKHVRFEYAKVLAQDADFVAIYPEVVIGNPLGASKVVRWLLYFPGHHGGEDRFNTSECVFTFSSEFVKASQYSNVPQLRIIDTMLDNFSNLNLDRQTNLILLKKSSFDYERRAEMFLNPFLESIPNIVSADKIINEANDVVEFNLELNRAKYFISFDLDSYHNVLASLAGCISIVVPDPILERSNFYKIRPEFKFCTRYGFNSRIPYPFGPRCLKAYLRHVERRNIKEVRAFVKYIYYWYS